MTHTTEILYTYATSGREKHNPKRLRSAAGYYPRNGSGLGISTYIQYHVVCFYHEPRANFIPCSTHSYMIDFDQIDKTSIIRQYNTSLNGQETLDSGPGILKICVLYGIKGFSLGTTQEIRNRH